MPADPFFEGFEVSEVATTTPPASPAQEAPMTTRAKPLRWRKPTDHPQDNEDALWVADGIGGRYSITDEGNHVLLWMAEDNFAWQRFDTVQQAKDAAEANWQREFAKREARDE